MIENSSFISGLRKSFGMRLCVLFGTFSVCMLLVALLTSLLKGISWDSARDEILFSSSLQCVIAFIIPAIICGWFASGSPFNWLELNRVPNLRQVIGVIIVFIIFLPAMNQLVYWNDSLHFPESLSSLENQLREWENTAAQATSDILNVDNVGAIIVNVLIVGILTGLAEELFFRGAIQKVLQAGNDTPYIAIWVTAFIFSFFHFQFFGFLPRMLMGAFFGYLIWWSKSLWLPIFAHSLNNSLVVIIVGENTVFPAEVSWYMNFHSPVGDVPWLAIASVTATFLFIAFFRDYFFKAKKIDNGKENIIII